jgi:hypothetical protein
MSTAPLSRLPAPPVSPIVPPESSLTLPVSNLATTASVAVPELPSHPKNVGAIANVAPDGRRMILMATFLCTAAKLGIGTLAVRAVNGKSV